MNLLGKRGMWGDLARWILLAALAVLLIIGLYKMVNSFSS